MEVVLQWLDEIDDLVFAGFSIWGRLRRLCLAIALAAAVALHVVPGQGILAEPVPGLLSVSLAALAAWGGVATISVLAERAARAPAA
jgi:hypothetical protein